MYCDVIDITTPLGPTLYSIIIVKIENNRMNCGPNTNWHGWHT